MSSKLAYAFIRFFLKPLSNRTQEHVDFISIQAMLFNGTAPCVSTRRRRSASSWHTRRGRILGPVERATRYI